MADVAEGLVSGGDAPIDVFEAAMESKGVKGGGSSTVPSVASGLTFGGSQETPATAPAATAEEPGTTPEEAAPVTPLHDDPDIADYLARFDGDADKALKSAVEAQKALGRQGNELGELRQTVAKLEGMVEVIQNQPAAPAAPQITMTPDQIENAILERDGVNVATWAANEAPHLLDAVLEEWGKEEPYRALTFKQEYKDWLATQAAPAATTEELSRETKYVQNQLEAERMTASMDVVAGEFPDTYDNFKDLLPEALKHVPPAIQKLVISSNDGDQRDALRVVFEKAQTLHTAALAADARQANAARTSVAKTAARVTSGSLQPSAGVEESGATTREDEVAKFKASILSAETTSVSDGLTFGK